MDVSTYCATSIPKKYEFAKIFGLKMITKMYFHLGDDMVVTTHKNYVINMHYQIDQSSTQVTIKD